MTIPHAACLGDTSRALLWTVDRHILPASTRRVEFRQVRQVERKEQKPF